MQKILRPHGLWIANSLDMQNSNVTVHIHRTASCRFSFCQKDVNRFGVALLLLLVCAWGLFADIDQQQNQQPVAVKKAKLPISTTQWRRTNQGWQKISNWTPPAPKYQPQLHPAVIASAMMILSLMALLAFPGKIQPAEPDQKSKDHAPQYRKKKLRSPQKV